MWFPFIPVDKQKHMAAGALVAMGTALLWVLLAQFRLVFLSDVFVASVVGAMVAGATKEAADWLDNKAHPGMHGVAWSDFLATAAGSIPVIFAIAAIHYLDTHFHTLH